MSHVVDPPRWQDTPEQDLLVLADQRSGGRHALSLPFRDAQVIETTGAAPAEITGTFDTVVIDVDGLDCARLATLGSRAAAALRPDGRVIITCGSAESVSPAGDSAATWLSGLRWEGLAHLNGAVCAVLRACDEPDESEIVTAARLATAVAAVRLADQSRATTPTDGGGALARHLEARQRSEHALLEQMARLAAELERARRRRPPRVVIRSTLERSRAGRRALVALRRLRARLRPR